MSVQVLCGEGSVPPRTAPASGRLQGRPLLLGVIGALTWEPRSLSQPALANTRTGRTDRDRGFSSLVLLVAALLLTPLIAIPFAVAGSRSRQRVETERARRERRLGLSARRRLLQGSRLRLQPGVGCSYCSTDHNGYDMAQGCGATIYAAGPGRVITAGSYQGYGNAVRIDHGGGLITLYGHMQWGSIRVSVGDSVTAGTPLGAEGNTGRSFGCHLHYEVLRDGVSIDPQPFMAALGLPLK